MGEYPGTKRFGRIMFPVVVAIVGLFDGSKRGPSLCWNVLRLRGRLPPGISACEEGRIRRGSQLEMRTPLSLSLGNDQILLEGV